MEKKTVIERFKSIKELEIADGSETSKTVEDILPYFCKNIDEALLRLETIDNAEPSEALKCLHTIALNTLFIAGMNFGNELRTIEQYIIKAQEQEKVLDDAIKLNCKWADELDYYQTILSIIKEKNVHLDYLNECSSAKQYNKAALLDEELSDEEFNLLKEFSKK